MLTKEQKVQRMKGLGASDTAIHMGYSTFMTPYELWMQKSGMISCDDKESELQYWGNKLERPIAERFAEENNCVVTFPDTIYHPEYEYIFANLDGWVEETREVVEIKNVNSFMRHKWDKALDDGVPMQYLIQIAKQCMVADASRGYCAVLIGGCEYQQYVYERDLELEALILKKDIEFWRLVTEGVQPDVQTIQDCRLKYKEVDEEATIQANYRTEQQYTKLLNVKQKMKELKSQEEELKRDLMDYMAHSQYLMDADGVMLATWKANKKGVRTFKVKE